MRFRAPSSVKPDAAERMQVQFFNPSTWLAEPCIIYLIRVFK